MFRTLKKYRIITENDSRAHNKYNKLYHGSVFFVALALILAVFPVSSSSLNNQVAAQESWEDSNLCVNPGDMLQYEGPGLAIRYPCDWREVGPEKLAEQGVDAGNYVIGFVSPQGSDPDSIAEYITITADKLPSLDIPIEELAAEQISYLERSFGNMDFELIESSPITISGDHPAQALVYTYLDPSSPDIGQAKTMEVITQDGDEVFMIDYTAEAEDFDTFLPDVEQIVSSLQFLCLNCQLTGEYSFDGSSTSPDAVPPDRIITPDCDVVTDGSQCYN